MPIQQLYYTSTKNPHTNMGGFQVVAVTPSLAKPERRTLDAMMSYAIPPHLQQSDITTHPVALRYLPLNGQRAALVCSQSIGTDENGRPGNYFAHAVVGEMALLSRQETIPPVTYWGSSYWLTAHDASQRDIAEVPSFSAKPAFDYNAVFAFIQSGQRPKLLRALLGAIAAGQTRLLIKDTPENIVQWIYAASLALPSRLRNFLSFSTYSHDPQNTPFMLTGVLPEQTIAGPSWLLDGVNQTAPSTAASMWGDLVVDYFTIEQYESDVRDLLDWMNNRLRYATSIPRNLDALVDFNRAMRKGVAVADWQRVAQAVQAVADTVPQQAEPSDINDVTEGLQLITKALKDAPDEGMVRPLAQLAMSQPNVSPPAVAAALVTAINGQQRSIAKRIATLLIQELNGAQALTDAAIVRDIRINTLESAISFWDLVAPHANLPGTDSNTLRTITHSSLRVYDDAIATGGDQAEAAERLLGYMAAMMREQPKLLLPLISEYKQDYDASTAFDRLYYAAVEKLTPQQRFQDYWRVYWERFDGLAITEFRLDLRSKRSTDDKADRLLEWLGAMEDEWRRDMLSVTLAELWPDVDQQRFGNRLIAEEIARANLIPQWYTALLEAALHSAMIDYPDARTMKDYEAFESTMPIGPVYAAVFEGSLALKRKTLHYEVANHIHERFTHLTDAGIYEHEASRLIETFFAAKPDEHLQLIRAAYTISWRVQFWTIYHAAFKQTLLDAGDVRAIMTVLNFWFTAAGELFSERPFAVQDFFIQLPNLLATCRNERAYKRIEQSFEEALMTAPWATLVEDAMSKGRRGRLGGLLGG